MSLHEHHSEEGHISAKEKLKQCTSIADALDLAIGFEQTAHDFYCGLQTRVSKHIRYLVEELAQEEQRHVEHLTRLKNHPEVQQHINDLIRLPKANARFSDYLQRPHLSEQPDDQEVLQYALGREQAAMQHYEELAELTDIEELRDLFIFLAREEADHKAELEHTYMDLIHQGGH